MLPRPSSRPLRTVASRVPPRNRPSECCDPCGGLKRGVHGEPEDTLELEELGTVDTLVDVVGFCVGLRELGVEKVYAAPLVLGEASPPRRAGGYANPAPATLELVAASGAPVSADSPAHAGAGELTTPTGAALITALAEFRRPAFSVQGVGVGLGTKDPPGFANALRIWVGEAADEPRVASNPQGQWVEGIFQQASVVLLETNLDDASGLVLGYAQEQLFALGALDVWHTPVQMKKNRPGAVLSALVPKQLEEAAVELILRETPTLGIRSRPVDRYVGRTEQRQHRHRVRKGERQGEVLGRLASERRAGTRRLP